MYPKFSKNFVSPMANRSGGSTEPSSARSPYFTPTRPSAALLGSSNRKLADSVPDSDDEEASSSFRPDDFEDRSTMDEPVARLKRTAIKSLLPGKADFTFTAPQTAGVSKPLRVENSDSSDESYWMVQWRRPQAKKHSKPLSVPVSVKTQAESNVMTETWDGDGVLVVRGNRCFMKDMDGKDIASASYSAGRLSSGVELKVGGKEVEVDHEIPAQQYLDGTCFGYGVPAPPQPTRTLGKPLQKIFKQPIPAASFFSDPKKSVHLIQKPKVGEPKHDPNAPGAIVMKRPSKDHAAKYNRSNAAVVDVVVDPTLGSLLRPHQQEGVKFMYECIMGMKKMEGTGCILADEMGLGKTLQTITLIHTLLQQNPYGGPSAGGVIGKVLVVSPVSLVQNWKKEFHKWLGKHRIGVFVGDGDKHRIRHFAASKGHQVLLIGYEKLRTVIDSIKTCVPPIGLIICDEGHRLKSKDNKTTKMFDSLSTKRRIILSGTPLQNDLQEYWSMADFACPGLLDTYSAFSKIYEKPILNSRAPKCSAKDQELGRARADKLGEITREFVLRRSADILSNYLPPKHEYVLYIAPTTLQLAVLAKILSPKLLQTFTRGATAQCLALITILKKVCNSPVLLKNKDDVEREIESDMKDAIKLIPSGAALHDISLSGKMIALDKLLARLNRYTEEKIVLVSNYTSTLDMLEAHCDRQRYNCLRLDGSTPQKSRQDLVDSFNRGSQHQSFVFLLSSKAGGVGLNLIGASRLVLFDSDWNPSTDLQAQARIHRDGQKRPVHIYRFLTTGTIEEKIFQRQVTKMGLSDQLIDQAQNSKGDSDAFSAAELKDLFTVQTKTNGCQTHDLLECECLIEQIKAQQVITESNDVSDASDLNSDLPELGDHEDDDADSDDEEASFVPASQYTGKTSKKEQAKTARDKQAKLAALHKWTHIDPAVSESFALLQDDLLGKLIGPPKGAPKHVTRKSLEAQADIADSQDGSEVGSEADSAQPNGLSDVDDCSDDDLASTSRKRAPSPDWSSEEDETTRHVTKKQKFTTKMAEKAGNRSPAVAEKSTHVDLESNIGRKYDLNALAQSQQAGRVTFIFEKVSRSKL